MSKVPNGRFATAIPGECDRGGNEQKQPSGDDVLQRQSRVNFLHSKHPIHRASPRVMPTMSNRVHAATLAS